LDQEELICEKAGYKKSCETVLLMEEKRALTKQMAEGEGREKGIVVIKYSPRKILQKCIQAF